MNIYRFSSKFKENDPIEDVILESNSKFDRIKLIELNSRYINFPALASVSSITTLFVSLVYALKFVVIPVFNSESYSSYMEISNYVLAGNIPVSDGCPISTSKFNELITLI